MVEPQIVLFICTGNYYRSRYAELYFNARVPVGAGWRAESRGFAPDASNVGPIARSVLARLAAGSIAAPVEVRMPLSLTQNDLEQARYIVALDAAEHPPYVEHLFPHWRDQFRYWQVADLGFMSVEDALSGIERAVDTLIAELIADFPPSSPRP